MPVTLEFKRQWESSVVGVECVSVYRGQDNRNQLKLFCLYPRATGSPVCVYGGGGGGGDGNELDSSFENITVATVWTKEWEGARICWGSPIRCHCIDLG